MRTMETRQKSDAQTQETVSTRNKTVLVVDDDAILLDLNRVILEMDGYKVFTAKSGRHAMTVLSEIEVPDLILLDMQMEDMSGAEFLKVLEEKRPEIIESVPVVFVTAMDKIPESNATGFIRKPMDIEQFLKAVRRFIELGVWNKNETN